MSDEAETFDCPACGAPLDRQRARRNLVTCTFCGKQVIVPESLRKPVGSRATVIQAQKMPRWVSCFVIAIFLLILGSAVLSIAAPLVLTRMITGEVARVVPGMDGDGQNTIPNNSPTIDAVLTQVGLSQPLLLPDMANPVLEFGEEGTGPGMFSDARWVGVDPAGSLYTAEYQDGRVQKFDPNGKLLAQWNVKSKVPLLDLAVSRQGMLYIVQQGKILKFDAETGAALGNVAAPGAHYFNSVATTADGGLAAISDGDDLVRFDAAEQVILTIPDAISSITGESELDARVALDGLGTMYVLGSNNPGVFVFSPEGKYQTRIGSEPDQLRAANDVAVDGQGRLYISDILGVVVFNASGRYLGSIDVEGAPFGLALDDQNRLVVLTNAPKLVVLEIIE